MEQIIVAILIAVSSATAAYFFSTSKVKKTDSQASSAPLAQADLSNEKIVIEARNKAKEILLEARDKALREQEDVEERIRKLKDERSSLERELAVKKTELDAKEREVTNNARQLKELKERLEQKEIKLSQSEKEQQDKLENIANLTKEEARTELLASFDKELVKEKAKRLRQIEEEIKENADTIAQDILVSAMRYGATDYVVEHTTSRVKLPDDDIKGRIIGKEGRNIKMFEELTGVELDLDSSPGEVIISCFDPVRREIAKEALERLIKDGRIQPAKIEETIEKATQDIERIMHREGKNLCHRVNVYDIPEDLVKMLGKFKYRYSYGQNMIEHTLEETRIGMAIAQELNANVEIVKLGCLYHDIGKIVENDEGTHVQLGADLLRKYKIDPRVIACVEEHHEDKPFTSVESMIVNLADHVSGARPGSRTEDYDSYIKRMKALEDAAYSFQGVEKAYAISAGREVRVFVKPEVVDDDSTSLLAREIAKKIELEQTYPGVVKVTAVRETRFSETAK